MIGGVLATWFFAVSCRAVVGWWRTDRPLDEYVLLYYAVQEALGSLHIDEVQSAIPNPAR